MIKTIISLAAVAFLIYVLSLHWSMEKNIPVTKLKTDSHLIDSLRHQLQTTIDSLNSYKPAIENAIKRLQFYDSLYKNKTSVVISDTLWIKRMRSDLFEARLEITRLAEPRY